MPTEVGLSSVVAAEEGAEVAGGTAPEPRGAADSEATASETLETAEGAGTAVEASLISGVEPVASALTGQTVVLIGTMMVVRTVL